MEENFHGKVSTLELSLMEKKSFIWLQSWIARNLRQSLPVSRHVGSKNCDVDYSNSQVCVAVIQSSFMICTGKMASELRRALDVHNSFVGYAYLLDKEGLVRWKAHAMPTPEELQTIITCTQKLLDT